MKEGDIVKAALNQSDGKLKFRPVLLLKECLRLVTGWFVE